MEALKALDKRGGLALEGVEGEVREERAGGRPYFIFDNRGRFEDLHGLLPQPLHPYRRPVESYVGGHHGARLTGSQVRSPAPDGNGAVIEVGEEPTLSDGA